MTTALEAPDAVTATLRGAIDHALVAGRDGPLAEMLYSRWYSGHRPVMTEAAVSNLVETLRAAHADSDRFEGGWSAVRAWPSGRAVAARGPVQRVLDPVDYVCPGRPGLPPRAGAPVRVTARRDSVTAQAGYWVTWGGDWGLPGQPADQVRLYWNIDAAGAPALVRTLTAGLGGLGVAYAMKVPSEATGFGRRDAAVLFLGGVDFTSAGTMLRAAHADLAGVLAPETPALTRRLAAGLGCADEPLTGESFGMSRCRLIAEALTSVLQTGQRDPEVLLRAIHARFRAEGLDPERPHLNAATERDRDW